MSRTVCEQDCLNQNYANRRNSSFDISRVTPEDNLSTEQTLVHFNYCVEMEIDHIVNRHEVDFNRTIWDALKK